MKKRGIALIWAIILSSVMVIISTTMVNYIVKESRFTIDIQESTNAFYGARSGIDWALQKIDKDNPKAPFTESFNIGGGATGVKTVAVAVNTTYNIADRSYTVLSTGVVGQTTRKLEYIYKSDPWRYVEIPEEIDDVFNIGYNSESFSIQFDYWQPGTRSHSVGVGTGTKTIYVYNDGASSGIELQARYDSYVGTVGGTTFSGTGTQYLASSGSGRTGYTINDDPHKNATYRYRMRIDYLKDTSATLTILRRVINATEASTSGRPIGAYICVKKHTIDLSGVNFGNLDRIYYDNDNNPRNGTIYRIDDENAYLRKLGYFSSGVPGTESTAGALFANFMTKIPESLGDSDADESGEGGGDSGIDPTPIPVFESVDAGASHSLGIKSDGTLWSWGSNTYGELGRSGVINIPGQIGTENDWRYISAGFGTSFAIKSDGRLFAWGRGTNGRLGLGSDLSNRAVPNQIGTDADWSLVDAGSSSSLAIKDTGTLWSWGLNGSGELGLNDTTQRIIPTRVGTFSDWEMASMGINHALGIRSSDNSLWSWGDNLFRQLGHNDTTSRLIPTRVGTNTGWVHVSAGTQSSYAINSGQLWTWGANTNGRLGLNDTTTRGIPTRVGTDSDWKVVEGGMHALAIKGAGYLWSWGTNTNGELGIGDTTPRYIPTIVSATDSSWSKISVGKSSLSTFSLGYKNDSTTWGWGKNSGGELGLGDITPRLVPTEISN
jgi:alpha-tubulin suppressor-like RCC1 family protein